MNLRIRVIDDNHYDELIALRTEMMFQPNDDGSPSTQGRVVFHTRWLHFRFGVKFAESIGPRIEHSFDSVLGRTFNVPTGIDESGEPVITPVPTMLMVAGLKEAFDVLANEYLVPPTEAEDEPQPPYEPIASTPPLEYSGNTDTPTDT